MSPVTPHSLSGGGSRRCDPRWAEEAGGRLVAKSRPIPRRSRKVAGKLRLHLIRTPFDVFAKRLISKNSRDDKTPLELFLAGIRD